MYLPLQKPELFQSDLLLGAYHYMHNHWCLVAIDMKEQLFTFIDPKCPRDAEILRGTQCVSNWCMYSVMRNQELPQHKAPSYFRLRVLHHAQQATMDYNNCGIYTLTVS